MLSSYSSALYFCCELTKKEVYNERLVFLFPQNETYQRVEVVQNITRLHSLVRQGKKYHY